MANLNSFKLIVVCLSLCTHLGLNAFILSEETIEGLPDITCLDEVVTELDDKCQILKVYNQTQIDELTFDNELKNVTEHCVCQLLNMVDLWRSSFYSDKTEMVTKTARMVREAIERYQNKTVADGTVSRYPLFLWSDIETTIYGYSIYISNKDYFDKAMSKDKEIIRKYGIPDSIRRTLSSNREWIVIKRVCRRIREDPHKLFRYMEILNRVSPVDFIRMLRQAEFIENVYDASKACKLLILLKINQYKLKPDNPMLISVESLGRTEIEEDDDIQRTASLDASDGAKEEDDMRNLINSDYGNDIDAMLQDSSALLLNCKPWQREKLSVAQLKQKCPLMVAEDVSKLVPGSAPVAVEASATAKTAQTYETISCACQLLLHNSTWERIIKDKNVQVMATALTQYMNENKVPNFSESSMMSIKGWFDNIMGSFRKNRKRAIAEINKVRHNSRDIKEVVKKTNSEEALELLRQGCNYVMFNHNKGSKKAVIELELIKYLDNLQLISRDPMLVFHLILQDQNLFKLYALSKMCQPFVF